ncbi:MAG: hypothetical protein ABIW83_05350 [Allosphingosinicella sp.]
MILMMMLLSLSAQDDRIAISGGLPQSPNYRITTELTCKGEGKYVFVVENRGFGLSHITSTLDGAPVELKNRTGTLQSTIPRLREISIEPSECGLGSGALVQVRGTDSDPSSTTFGERVSFLFGAQIDCEHLPVSERGIFCRPKEGR